jgi:large subunit ribosomal protein L24
MKIKTGDRVVVLSGKDKGTRAVVLSAIPDAGKVVVEGVNVVKRHTKPTRAMEQGGIIDKEMPIDVSNVAIVSPGDDKATRVGYRIDADGTKTRICKRTGVDLP